MLHHALADPDVGRVALVSSFGAESVVLLHMVSVVDRTLPVLFLDTRMLFPETLDYQREVSARLRPDRRADAASRRGRPCRRSGRARCMPQTPMPAATLRKTQPLQQALSGFDAWITGRKRFQGGQRTDLEFFEVEDATGRLKVNPLAHWAPGDVQDYIENNRLPRHPLVARGLPLDRLRALHLCGGRGRGSAGGSLARPRQGRMRHSLRGRQGRPRAEEGRGMNIIVTDSGFSPDDWARGFAGLDGWAPGVGPGLDVGGDADPVALRRIAVQTPPEIVRIAFPGFADGRGFTLARMLRGAGFAGRLRAAGHVLADQYAMARRSGFDEVEIDEDLAARQHEAQWLARARWSALDYQARLGRRPSLAAG